MLRSIFCVSNTLVAVFDVVLALITLLITVLFLNPVALLLSVTLAGDIAFQVPEYTKSILLQASSSV